MALADLRPVERDDDDRRVGLVTNCFGLNVHGIGSYPFCLCPDMNLPCRRSPSRAGLRGSISASGFLAGEEQERLSAAQRRLLTLRLQLGGKLGDGRLGPPVCVLFEGWDASGKGGAIKRLVAPLDLRHVARGDVRSADPGREAPPIPARASPRRYPAGADMSVLDRSWYGRVLVERVEGYLPASMSGRGPTKRSSSSSA